MKLYLLLLLVVYIVLLFVSYCLVVHVMMPDSLESSTMFIMLVFVVSCVVAVLSRIWLRFSLLGLSNVNEIYFWFYGLFCHILRSKKFKLHCPQVPVVPKLLPQVVLYLSFEYQILYHQYEVTCKKLQ